MAQLGEDGEDLLAGGVIGQRRRRRGRFRGGFVVLAGEGEEGLAGDLQVADRPFEFAEPGGELIDQGPGLSRACQRSRSWMA